MVIHRAVSGSFERFMAILIEHFAGAFPLWLAPEQVRVLPISDAQGDAARKVFQRFREAGIRAGLDDGNQTLNYRIRQGEVEKIPYMAVVGQREADAGTVAVRVRGAGNKQGDRAGRGVPRASEYARIGRGSLYGSFERARDDALSV